MVGLGNDLRYAVRLLIRTPGFTASVALVLALAIGANAVAFSFVNSLFLRPLPGVEDPRALVRIYATYDNGPRYFTVSYPDYRHARGLERIFAGVVADQPAPLHLSVAGQNERVWAYLVSGNYFSVLGVRPALGRLFVAEEDEARGSDPVVLSHGFWRRRFGGDRGVIGTTVALNRQPFTVVGVAPEGFHGVNVGLKPELWVPVQRLAGPAPEERGGYFLVGRLRPGVTIGQARAATDVLARQLQLWHPDSNRGITLTLLPEAEGGVHPMVRGGFVGFSGALATVVGLVLLLACTNVSGLLLARAATRRKEIGVRLALGAGRGRIVRQLLTESLLLWSIAGAIAAGLAVVSVRALASVELPTDRPLFVDVAVDVRVLGFSLLATVVSGLAFGLVPSLAASRSDLVESLKESGRALGFRSPLRSALVAGQVALCVVLLVGAFLCLRSLSRAQQIDLGFDPQRVTMVSVNLGPQGYDEGAAERFFREVVTRLSRLPGVDSVGLANRVPFELNIIRLPAASPGDEHVRSPSVDFAVVDGGYFRALRIPLREGRVFDPRDSGSPPVVVVNETLARRFWAADRAVGRRLVVGGQTREVVGVVKDGKYLTLGEEPTPFVYLPFEQGGGSGMTVLVRSSTVSGGSELVAAPELLSRVRQEIAALDPTLPVYNVKTMREHLAIAFIPAGLGAAALGSFGALALLLASVGLYGLLAQAVAQRTHEIGIRRAVGAQDVDVIALVLRQALSPVAVGLIGGVALGVATSPLLRSLLYGIGPTDPAAYAVAVASLLLTAALACYLPAHRAARIEPMAALREK